jgi:uncharacterized protein HemY
MSMTFFVGAFVLMLVGAFGLVLMGVKFIVNNSPNARQYDERQKYWQGKVPWAVP